MSTGESKIAVEKKAESSTAEARPGIVEALKRWVSPAGSEAPQDFNRWMAIPPSFLLQLSIGSVYAWSTFNSPLTRIDGVVVSSANDWALNDVVPIFSFCAVTLGICTASLGTWAEKAGPRKV